MRTGFLLLIAGMLVVPEMACTPAAVGDPNPDSSGNANQNIAPPDAENAPVQVVIREVELRGYLQGEPSLNVAAAPSHWPTSRLRPYDVDSAAQLFVLLDADGDAENDDPGDPEEPGVHVLDVVALPEGFYAGLSFSYDLRELVVPEALRGGYLRVRVSVTDGEQSAHAYAEAAVHVDAEGQLVDACQTPCEPGTEGCDPEEFAEYEFYEEGRAALLERAVTMDCDASVYLLSGESDDGSLVLFATFGVGGFAFIYDPQTHVRIGQVRWSDETLPGTGACHGVSYWPAWLDIGRVTPTEAICGDPLEIGGLFWLPQPY